VLPGDTSPPKSGCSDRPEPIYVMKPADAESTGAAEISRFHQLSLGNSGNGPGSGPPIVLTAATTAVSATTGMSVASSVRRRRRGISLANAKAEPGRLLRLYRRACGSPHTSVTRCAVLYAARATKVRFSTLRDVLVTRLLPQLAANSN